MLSYAARRLAFLVPVVFLVSMLSFFLLHLAPSDPVTMKYVRLGTTASQETIVAEKRELGLDRSIPAQYGTWLFSAMQGDFGKSYNNHQSVAGIMAKRLPNTIALALGALFLTIFIALPLAMAAVLHQNTALDYGLRLFSFWGTSMPTFWLGLLLMYAFGVRLRLLPVMGSGDFSHFILPCITLSVWLIALYVRRFRSGLLLELSKAYGKSLAMRGYGRGRILLRHILPNAAAPILVLLGLSIGDLLGGTIVVEIIFGWQGIGSIALEAVQNRDYPVLQAYVLWMALAYGLANLAADLLASRIDPRLRRTERAA